MLIYVFCKYMQCAKLHMHLCNMACWKGNIVVYAAWTICHMCNRQQFAICAIGNNMPYAQSILFNGQHNRSGGRTLEHSLLSTNGPAHITYIQASASSSPSSSSQTSLIFKLHHPIPSFHHQASSLIKRNKVKISSFARLSQKSPPMQLIYISDK